MKSPLVSLVRQADYDADKLLKAVEKLLEPLGGMSAFVGSGDRVVVKPNILFGTPPGRAVTTHPALVGAVTRLALDCGGIVQIGDSPGREPVAKAAEKCGIAAVARELGVRCIDFTPLDVVDDKRTFRKLTLARELLDADVVINLPKLKTHCMMVMTMAVKNMFGAVLGFRKFQWHLRAGRDKRVFGRMLYEICRAVGPELSIMDAVVSMDGNGPGNGNPVQTGFLAAGADPSALDAVLLDIIGISRDKCWTLSAAREAGDREWERVETVGASPEDLRPNVWNLPATMSAELPLPPLASRIPYLSRWLRSQMAARPRPIGEACILCGECADLCPTDAISIDEKGLSIDDRACIRCYCCHELCTHRAMGLKKGFLGRLIEGIPGPS